MINSDAVVRNNVDFLSLPPAPPVLTFYKAVVLYPRHNADTNTVKTQTPSVLVLFLMLL